METEDFDEKQQAELDAFEEKQRRSYEMGKKIVYLIAGINILFDIITIFISHEFNFTKFLIHTALAIALIYGVTWVRYLYAVSGILTIVLIIMALPAVIKLLHFSAVSRINLLVLILAICYSAVSPVVLICSKSVKDYMYTKKSERQ